jgi:aminoglycoside phosphotransferase (APT) family kinase protein
VLSFWECAEGETDAVTAGHALRECHTALRGFKGSLPVLGGLSEAEAMLSRLATEGKFSLPEATELQRRFDDLTGPLSELRSPIQPLHGDAHLNNVLNTAAGPLWNDWEDTCLGPLGWDAACLKLTRDGGERAEAALAASGIELDPTELALWVEARSLQVDVWRAFIRGA